MEEELEENENNNIINNNDYVGESYGYNEQEWEYYNNIEKD